MPRPLSGLDLQASIVGYLQKFKFTIQEEEEWDHNNKIDFVITKFPNYPKSLSLGVQVTGRCGDRMKMNEFVARNDPTGEGITVADKALYLEVEENVVLNRGGAELIANVLYAFQFDEKFAKTKVQAATIQALPDAICYRFFDPRPTQPVTTAKTVVARTQDAGGVILQTLSTQPRELEGKLNSYFPDQGYGFIEAQDGSSYYLHVSEVLRNDPLAEKLEALMRLPGKTSLRYHVIFEDGGKTRQGALYRVAKNVRLLVG